MTSTETLRTQYVDDLNVQKELLKSTLLKNKINVSNNEGMTSLTDKLNDIQGIPVLKHYNFAYGNARNIEEDLKHITLASQEDFSACFAHVKNTSYIDGNTTIYTPLDLTNVNFNSAKNLDYMLSCTSNFILGESFVLTNVESMKGFVSGSIYTTNGYSSGHECYRDVSKVKKQNASNVKDLSYFFHYGNVTCNFGKDLAQFIKDFFSKITFDNNELNIDRMFYTIDTWEYNATDDYIKHLIDAAKILGNSLKHPISMQSTFDGGTFATAAFIAPYLNYENVKYMNNFAGDTHYNNNELIDKHLNTLDFSEKIFYKLESLYYAFREAFKYNQTDYPGSLIFGTVPNETLKSMNNFLADNQGVHKVYIDNVNMGGVTNVRDIFGGCKNLKYLRFGYNLGKGYTSTSSNTSDYELNLVESTLLERESLLDVINKLYDLNITYGVYDENHIPGTGKLRTQGLKLGTKNLEKLTPEEIAIATNKGWTVS